MDKKQSKNKFRDVYKYNNLLNNGLHTSHAHLADADNIGNQVFSSTEGAQYRTRMRETLIFEIAP